MVIGEENLNWLRYEIGGEPIEDGTTDRKEPQNKYTLNRMQNGCLAKNKENPRYKVTSFDIGHCI